MLVFYYSNLLNVCDYHLLLQCRGHFSLGAKGTMGGGGEEGGRSLSLFQCLILSSPC
jgi:hypothetical protein